jgi:hypothetical protein
MSNYSKTRYNRTREFWMKKRKHELTELPDWYSDIEKRYIEAIRKKNEIDEELSEIRDELLSWMKEDKLNKIITNDTEVYVIRSYNGRKVNATKLKNERPDIFFEYSTPYTMNEHLQVTINKSKKLND